MSEKLWFRSALSAQVKIIAALLLILSSYGCSEKWPGHGAYKGYNVVIVLFDATRYDHLGYYGYKRDTSPNIDKLSKKSLVFTNAIAQATWTKPSVVSLFTSNYVKDHGVVSMLGIDISSSACPQCMTGDVLSPQAMTLTKVLKAQGYQTTAFIDNALLSKGHGLEQGFDEYEEIHPASKQTAQAIAWVKAHKKSKFFMYLHYLAPHAPYDPPARYRTRFKSEYKGKFVFQGRETIDVPLSQEEMDELMARYDGEICFADYWSGRFLSFLRKQKLLKKTLVVFVADHGEALGENGPIGHGYGHEFNKVVQVPLFIFPGEGHRASMIT